MDLITTLPGPLQAALATCMMYLFTMAGAALVLTVRHGRPVLMDSMLAFGAGIMLAAAFWSLLAPAISQAQAQGQTAWLITALGVAAGAAFLMLGDALVSRRMACTDSARRCRLLIASITLHNIPEGLAVGVAFGAITAAQGAFDARSAWMLALGIAIQNFPEGASVSLPLLREGHSRRTAFRYGQRSGLVEPVAGVLGALLAAHVRPLLPFLLAFAGGAMLLAVVAELIPESQRSPAVHWMTAATLAGFILMMVLDVAFG